MTLKKSRIDYKWVVLVTCFLMEFICMGFGSSNVGLYTVPVTSALGIDRAVYAVWSSIRYGTQVLMALFFGTLINRFGIKKIVATGLCAMLGATVLRATGTHFLHFYVAGALHGISTVFVGSTMAGTIIRRWFKEDVGRYTGIVMSANGIGGAISAQIISPIINNGETFGYRKAYLLSAAITLTISIIILLLLKDQPAGGPVIGTAKKKARGTTWVGIDYATVKKKHYFYIAAAFIFITGISLQSIGSITITYMTDLGLPASFIAATATVASITLTFSKLLVGISYDKKGLRFTLLLCQFAGLATFLLKAQVQNNTLGMVIAMVATLLANIAAPLETVMIPLLTNDLFGSASYNKVLGIFVSMNSLGLCLGSPIGELLKKLTGDYRLCFWFFGFTMAAAIIGFQIVLRAAYKQKNAILAAENAQI